MSRSTTMLMLFLVPMISQAAVVPHKSAVSAQEEAVCRSNLNANSSRSRGVIWADGRGYRLHQVDTGGMLAMGYSYYGAQRPHRAAAARKALGIRVAKKGRRSVLLAGNTHRIRHSSIKPSRCIARTRRASS
jgi:hypothetical protein